MVLCLLTYNATFLFQDKYTIETMVVWGDDGKFVSTKGNLLRSGNTLDGDLTLDSPDLKANKWNVRISKKLSGNGRNTAELRVLSAEEEKASFV